jgi:UDP-N-acetylmuramoylalanine--D-glutamate ligase
MRHLHGLPVLILGLGESGLAMARWCLRCGARVRVWDSREAPPQRDALDAPAVFFSGALDAAALEDAQLVLKSPGLAPHDERIAALLAAAGRAGIAVQGELDLFVRALADLAAEGDYTPRLLAVTGTNGKTTTAMLTAQLVERAGRHVALAGNVGPTMLATLAAAIDAEAAGDAAALPEVWVLELSSFQLHGVQGFEPSAAVVLNVTQDHLDWHGSIEAYAADKSRIYGERAVMVVNRDDPLVRAMVPQRAPAKGSGRTKAPERKVVSYGLEAPTQPGDYGLVSEGGMTWLARALDADATERRRKDEPAELHLQRLMPADALHIRGRHNAANALAALALASAIGCPLAPMLHGLREYRGEPHRVEFIGAVGGIEAFDDSKGTNVGATVAALLGLGADQAPGRLLVILGGDGKGQDFAPLAEPVRRHARAVATIGRDAPAVEVALHGTGVAIERHATLEAAVRWCFAQAKAGDAVLLSPACASLDMFRNYKHRAEVFVAEVRELAAQRGEVLA